MTGKEREQAGATAVREATAEEAQVAKTLAAFFRATTMYPKGHPRVEAGARAFLEAVAAVRRDPEERVAVFVARGRVWVGEAPVAKPDETMVWVAEKLAAGRVAGIEVRSPARPDSLALLAESFRANLRNSDPDRPFHEIWPGPFFGFRVLERRFEGLFGRAAHDGGAEDADPMVDFRALLDTVSPQGRVLAEFLESSNRVQALIERVQSGLESAGEEDARNQSVNLLGHIVHALPAEAMQSPEKALDMVQQVLEAVVASMDGPEGLVGLAEGNQLAGLMLKLCRQFFGSTEGGEDLEPGDTQRGHKGDEHISDDVGSLLREMDSLPRPGRLSLWAPTEETPEEWLGICLHRLARYRSDQEARRIHPFLRECLADPGARELDVLGSYVDVALGTDRSRTEPGCGRVVAFLQEEGLAPLLLRCRGLTPHLVKTTFPSTFLLFVDALDTAVPEGRAMLADVCADLGPRAILAAELELTRPNGIQGAQRAEKILRVTHRAVVPLAKVIARHGGPEARGQVAEFLRKLVPPSRAAAALRHVEPPETLPAAHLCDLSDALMEGRTPKGLEEEAVDILRGFIKEHAFRREGAAQRGQAVAALAAFPDPPTERFLRRLLRGWGWFWMRWEPHAVRAAARRALRKIRDARSGAR